MNIRNALQKAGHLISLLFCLLSLILLGSTIYQRMNNIPLPMILGWGAAIVETGSMEPAIPVGSMIIVHQQETYQKGDIITYESDSLSKVITHRIIDFRKDSVIAKGDANNVCDELFPESKIVGKVVSILPGAGKVFETIRQPATIIGIAAICAIAGVSEKLLRKRKEEEGRCYNEADSLPITERN